MNLASAIASSRHDGVTGTQSRARWNALAALQTRAVDAVADRDARPSACSRRERTRLSMMQASLRVLSIRRAATTRLATSSNTHGLNGAARPGSSIALRVGRGAMGEVASLPSVSRVVARIWFFLSNSNPAGGAVPARKALKTEPPRVRWRLPLLREWS